MSLRLPFPLALGLVLTGCAASLHDQKVDAAKQARARGDLGAEALAWAEACQADQKERDSCKEAERTASTLEAASLAKARPVCKNGDLEHCAAHLAALRRVRPAQPEALTLLREAERLHRVSCTSLEALDKPSTMLARWNCMSRLATLVADPVYEGMLGEEKVSAAKRFAYAGRGATPGASYVYHQTAQCFSKEIESGAEVQAAADAFVAATAIPIAIRPRIGGVSVLATSAAACGYVATALGPRAVCAQGGAVAPEFSLDLGLTLGAVDHRVTSETRVAEYVSGVERYPNPARPARESDAARAQASFDAIEQEALDREARCLRARTDARHPNAAIRACDAYNAIVPTYNQRKRVRDDALSDLARTPAVLERDIIERVPYTVRHHRWAVAYEVVGNSQAGANARESGVFERRDSEHGAVAPAGVRVDPLVPPSLEDFNADLRKVAVAVASDLYGNAFRKQATCGGHAFQLDDVAALECRARSELYLTGGLPRPQAWGIDCH